jgi:uncharacterized protein YndB with AHSA1/START domain
MTDSKPNIGTGTIQVDYDLPRPPHIVWRALTEPPLLAAWLMPNDIQPIVGHAFTFKTQPMADWDGTVYCQILEADAPRRLRYSWRGGPTGNAIDTEVLWILSPSAAGGTHLRLEHSGFKPEHAMAFHGLKQGWTGTRMVDRMLQAIGSADST